MTMSKSYLKLPEGKAFNSFIILATSRRSPEHPRLEFGQPYVQNHDYFQQPHLILSGEGRCDGAGRIDVMSDDVRVMTKMTEMTEMTKIPCLSFIYPQKKASSSSIAIWF